MGRQAERLAPHMGWRTRSDMVRSLRTTRDSAWRAGWRASIRGVLWLDTLLQLVSAGEVSAIWAMTAGIMTDRVAGNAAGVRCLCKHSTYLALATATAAAGAAAVGVTATTTAMDWLLTWSLEFGTVLSQSGCEGVFGLVLGGVTS